MYQGNIYIANHEEVAAMGGDIGVCQARPRARQPRTRAVQALACDCDRRAGAAFRGRQANARPS